jgi:hypothetical protein
LTKRKIAAPSLASYWKMQLVIISIGNDINLYGSESVDKKIAHMFGEIP